MRARIRENAHYLVFNIVECQGRYWRVLNGGATVMALVNAGARFAAFLPPTRGPHDCPIVSPGRAKLHHRTITRAEDVARQQRSQALLLGHPDRMQRRSDHEGERAKDNRGAQSRCDQGQRAVSAPETPSIYSRHGRAHSGDEEWQEPLWAVSRAQLPARGRPIPVSSTSEVRKHARDRMRGSELRPSSRGG